MTVFLFENCINRPQVLHLVFTGFRNEFGLDVRDPVQQNFSEILKDITMFYTKKLDMLNIKLEHHQRTKMDPEHHELVQVIKKRNNNWK